MNRLIEHQDGAARALETMSDQKTLQGGWSTKRIEEFPQALVCEGKTKRRRYRNMMNDQPARPTFHEGEEVVLALGTYQGTLGVFLRLKKDINWADIRERNGEIHSHPVVWLAHSPSAAPGSAN